MKLDWLIEHEVEAVKPSLKDIFFLSADPRNVTTDAAKNEAFFQKWTSYYFQNRADWMLLAWEGDRLLAYLMCEPDSWRALAHYEKVNPSYRIFEDLFPQFPAHLHMNAHPEARGHGVGSQLIEAVCARLIQDRVPGIHLVTSPSQRNVGFYRKNHFSFEESREWRSYPMLFMGRSLKASHF